MSASSESRREKVITLASAREFRAATRLQCAPDSQAHVLVPPRGFQQKAFVRDISTRGVGLLVTRPLQVGDRLALRLGTPGKPACRVVPARVVHCAPYQGPWWLAGCQLTRPLTEEEVGDLVGEWPGPWL
jgi:hypothetical protein